MKYSEFYEAVVTNAYYDSSNPSHKKYMTSIINSINNGGPVYAKIKGSITEVYFGTDYQKRVAKKAVRDHIKDINTGGTFKAPFVKGIDADGESVKFQIDKIEKRFEGEDGVTTVTMNVGNVTEGALGIALAAKFRNSKREITEQNVLAVGRAFFRTAKSTIRLNVIDRTSDKLQLKITLPSGDMMALEKLVEYKGNGEQVGSELGQSEKAKVKLQSLLPNVTAYANTGNQPLKAVDRIKSYYTDNIKQTISVISDGAEHENQSMTKVDLSISAIDGSGNEEIMSLLSIKSGTGSGKGSTSTQIGQTGGRTYEKLAKFWRQAFAYELPEKNRKDFEKTYKTLSPNGKFKLTKENVLAVLHGPIANTYKWAGQQINKHLKGDSTMGELQFLEHMQRGLLYHSAKHATQDDPGSLTRGDEEVVITYLNPDKVNAFVELNFGGAFKQLMEYFDLTPSYNSSESEHHIRIYAIPSKNIGEAPLEVQEIAKNLYKGAGDYLVSYRSHSDSKKVIRNTVNIGTQAKSLANLANLSKLTPPDQEATPQL